MSADFFSDVVVANNDFCTHWHETFRSRERLDDILGPDETSVFRFVDGHADPDPVSLAFEFPDRLATGVRELGPAYVDLDVALWEEYMARDFSSLLSSTSNYGALVVLDRAVAIPLGVKFLSGHAVRHVANQNLKQFISSWRSLLLQAGGAKKMTDVCRPFLDRGTFDVEEFTDFVDGIGQLAVDALEANLDLFMATYPVP